MLWQFGGPSELSKWTASLTKFTSWAGSPGTAFLGSCSKSQMAVELDLHWLDILWRFCFPILCFCFCFWFSAKSDRGLGSHTTDSYYPRWWQQWLGLWFYGLTTWWSVWQNWNLVLLRWRMTGHLFVVGSNLFVVFLSVSSNQDNFVPSGEATSLVPVFTFDL